jgi:hypothetical protein
MKHLKLLTAGLLASTMLAGIAVATPTNDNGARKQAATAAAPARNGENTQENAAADSATNRSDENAASNPESSAAATGEVSRNANSTAESPTGRVADTDFGRLSKDGASAFEDVHFARIAIFEGKTGQAAKLVADARNSLEAAKTDNTAFLKAESELHGMSQNVPLAENLQQPGQARTEWLPIDGEIVVGEAYQPSPQKDAAIVTARKNMQNGDSDKALRALKLAAVDVDYTLAVAPLGQSLADVELANDLMNSHDYYGASQALRKAEEGIRYDEIDDVANVTGKAKTASADDVSRSTGADQPAEGGRPSNDHKSANAD